jgi:hypothetical protein
VGATSGVSGVGAEGGVGGSVIVTGGAGGVGGVGAFGGTAGVMVTGGSGGVGGTGGSVGGTGGTSNGTACLECVSSSCPTASECFGNTACVQGIFCGLASCATGTDPAGLQCWLDCFNGDAEVALMALEAALCLGQNCAMACQGLTP